MTSSVGAVLLFAIFAVIGLIIYKVICWGQDR